MFSIVDIVSFFFDFVEPGGTNHLLPGRPLEQTRQITRPRGSGFLVSLNGINSAFVNGAFLGQRPLGQFRVHVGLRDPDIIVCRVRLTDENMDDAIRFQVHGSVMFFR